jgi:hypothetical protein
MAAETTRKESGNPDERGARWPFGGMARMMESCGCGCDEFGSMMKRAVEICAPGVKQDSPCCESRGDEAKTPGTNREANTTAKSS